MSIERLDEYHRSTNALSYTEPLPPSVVTGLPDMHRFPDTMGYPAISGGNADVRDYYERYLRNKYPDWSEDVIQANIDRAQRIPEVWENIKGMMELEKKIRKENPNWTGGWLGDDQEKKQP